MTLFRSARVTVWVAPGEAVIVVDADFPVPRFVAAAAIRRPTVGLAMIGLAMGSAALAVTTARMGRRTALAAAGMRRRGRRCSADEEGAQRDDAPAERTCLHDLSPFRSEEHTSELQSLMLISYAVFCLKKKKH